MTPPPALCFGDASFLPSFPKKGTAGRPLLLQGKDPLLGLFTHRILAHHLLDPLQPISSCIIVCGNNVFHLDILVRESQDAGKDPRNLLSRVHISRTVTIHQFHTLVLSRLEKRIEETGASLILLSGLLPLFADSAVFERESLGLLPAVMATLHRISFGMKIPCLIPVDRDEADRDRRSRRLFSLLESSSDSRSLVVPPPVVRPGGHRRPGPLFGTQES